ncbi:MAG: hypothetical protein R3C12_14930 [Planctomycetaceae bacterium]
MRFPFLLGDHGIPCRRALQQQRANPIGLLETTHIVCRYTLLIAVPFRLDSL